MDELRALLRLSVREWIVLGEAWVSLLGVDVALRFLSFPGIQRFAARVNGDHPAEGDVPALIRRLHRLVRVAARHHLYRMSCLRQALVLQRLLGRRGIPTTLRIGVRLETGDLDAHAWLEYENVPIGQPQGVGEQFAVLKSARAK